MSGDFALLIEDWSIDLLKKKVNYKSETNWKLILLWIYLANPKSIAPDYINNN